MMDVEKVSSVIKRLVLVVLGFAFLVMAFFGGYLAFNAQPVDPSSDKEVNFAIESGWSKIKVAEELKSQGLIRNSFVFKAFVFFASDVNIMAGTYKLSPNMGISEILSIITSNNSLESAGVTITFIEGKDFSYYVSKMAKELPFTEEDVYNKVKDQKYLKSLIDKYWFIDDSILNNQLYYPLEGYLFPDTYSFRTDASVEEALQVMLDEMDKKLSNYKEEITASQYSVHDLLTLASMVELEGNEAEDRSLLAGVFYNRLRDGWTLGSDVTTHYAVHKPIGQKLSPEDLASCNAYNTRGTCVKGLPVGPICSPSYSSITSAIMPETTKYMYFVADKNGKLYFGETESDHNNWISSLKKQGIWPENEV